MCKPSHHVKIQDLVVVEDFGTQLEVHVGSVFQGVTIAFRPCHEGSFPIGEEGAGRAVEGYPMSLQVGSTMETVEAGTAPVVVGVVGVHGKLEEDFRFLARVDGPQDEKTTAFRRAAVALDEFSAPVLHSKQNLIVTAFPVGGDGHLETHGPFAPMGGGMLGDRVFGSADTGLGEHGFRFGSVPLDLNPELPGAGGGVQLEFLPGSVAEQAGIALDEEGAWFVGDKVGEEGEQQAREKNGFVHGSVIEVFL